MVNTIIITMLGVIVVILAVVTMAMRIEIDQLETNITNLVNAINRKSKMNITVEDLEPNAED